MKISEGRGSSLYYYLCARAALGDLEEVILTLEDNINKTPNGRKRNWCYNCLDLLTISFNLFFRCVYLPLQIILKWNLVNLVR